VQVQFWGTRGSIPKPGSTTIHYGGNTLCHEIRTARGTLVIIDCGTGLHGLGLKLPPPDLPNDRASSLKLRKSISFAEKWSLQNKREAKKGRFRGSPPPTDLDTLRLGSRGVTL
jgi:hypothetical protein